MQLLDVELLDLELLEEDLLFDAFSGFKLLELLSLLLFIDSKFEEFNTFVVLCLFFFCGNCCIFSFYSVTACYP